MLWKYGSQSEINGVVFKVNTASQNTTMVRKCCMAVRALLTIVRSLNVLGTIFQCYQNVSKQGTQNVFYDSFFNVLRRLRDNVTR